MQRFDLCFALEADPPGKPIERYLLPLLLPPQPPASLNALPIAERDGQKLMKLSYQLNFVPSGLMSWLLVRTHRYSQNLQWRNGARLTFQDQQAHIELDERKSVISLVAWGSFPYSLLLILKTAVDELLDRFQGLQIRRVVPCPCEQHGYSYDDLARQYVNGTTEIMCRIQGTSISLAYLLYGVGPQSVPTDNNTSKEKRQKSQSLTLGSGKTRILFLAANPHDTSVLRLGEEMRGIQSALRQANYRDDFSIHQEWAVRVADLQDALLRYEPHIVHFSGHGSKSGRIMLEDEVGNSHPVSARALSNLFSLFNKNLRCVVLNACYSEVQAEAIAEHIDCVVGMSQEIGDTAAIGFAMAFYNALGYGKDVETAFNLGCVRIDMQNLHEQYTPKLIARRRDPATLRFAIEQ